MTLLIDACARNDSRTRRLTDVLLSKSEDPVEEVRLFDLVFEPTDEAFLIRRDRLILEGKTDDRMFALANQFARADRIVIAAPYWDLSFPAVLKQYFEKVNVTGITFFYTPQGIPQGLCRARELVYVSTAGGTFVPQEFGFGYIKALAENFYGIPKVWLVQAAGLDLDGADPEQILNECIIKHAVKPHA